MDKEILIVLREIKKELGTITKILKEDHPEERVIGFRSFTGADTYSTQEQETED